MKALPNGMITLSLAALARAGSVAMRVSRPGAITGRPGRPQGRVYHSNAQRSRRLAVGTAVVAVVVLGAGQFAAPAQASFPGRNGRIAFDTPAGGISTMRPDGTGVHRLVHLVAPASAFHASWSPDSRRMVFVVNDPDASLAKRQVWVMNADGSGQHVLFADPFFNDFGASYSPDGTKVVFSRCRLDYSACAIFRVTSDGTQLIGLTPFRTDILDLSANYSPDGRRLAFFGIGRAGIQGAIYLMQSDGTGAHRLTPAWLGAANPDWSPDGRRLVFQDHCCTAASESIWRINADGTGLLQLTHSGTGHSFRAVYAPAGNLIAFDRFSPDFSSSSVWVMRPDGSGAHQIRSDGDPSGWGSAS